MILKENATSANDLSFVADISLYVIGAGGLIVVIVAFLYMKRGEKSQKRMVVDDQGYVGAVVYIIQVKCYTYVSIWIFSIFMIDCLSILRSWIYSRTLCLLSNVDHIGSMDSVMIM